MQSLIAEPAAFAALIFAAVSLGGGAYETALVDRAWPNNIAFIQPRRGGIDRKLFWMPAHFAFELSLGLAIWSAWPTTAARDWLICAAVSHGVMRGWSFAYFIPRALKFERLETVGPELAAHARAWTRLSVLRLPLDVVGVISICLGVSALMQAA